MFFGQTISKGFPFQFTEHNVEEDSGEVLCVTNVALAPGSGHCASLFIQKDGQEYLVVTVNKEQPQAAINLFIALADQITLAVKGDGIVHLIGFFESGQEVGSPLTDQDIKKLQQLGIMVGSHKNAEEAQPQQKQNLGVSGEKVKIAQLQDDDDEDDQDDEDFDEADIQRIEAGEQQQEAQESQLAQAGQQDVKPTQQSTLRSNGHQHHKNKKIKKQHFSPSQINQDKHFNNRGLSHHGGKKFKKKHRNEKIIM